MVYSRRLYELDEVCAAFLVSLRKRRVEEALFWLEELELSAEDELATRLIFDIWFLQKGVKWWAFWGLWKANKDSIEGRRGLILTYCKHSKDIKDSSLWRSWCLAVACKEEWDTYMKSNAAVQWWCSGLKSREDCAQLWFDFLKPSYKEIEAEEEKEDKEYKWDIEVAEEECQRGIMKSRKYQIPYDAHLGLTRRGLLWQSTNTIRSTSLYSLLESPIWAGILDDYVDEENEWKSDEDKEAFYDKYFAGCDIPDEWPLAEQEKSHGRPPCMRQQCGLNQWWNIWVPEEHKYIWGKANNRLMEWVRSFPVRNAFDDIEALFTSEKRVYSKICALKNITYSN